MIPKKIHYVWVGGNSPGELMTKCMNSWQKKLPEYELICWNENRFDISSNRYVKEAYDAKKYAFVSDYIRLHALYEHGGIYMDTDVEILKPLDSFLSHAFFSGFESTGYIPTGLMGAVKGHPWIKEQLEYYRDRSFFLPERHPDLTPNVIVMTKSAKKYGLRDTNTYQELSNGCVFYPSEYFCPMGSDRRIVRTPRTYAIHHFMGSWLEPNPQVTRFLARRRFLEFFLGVKVTGQVIKLYALIIKIFKQK